MLAFGLYSYTVSGHSSEGSLNLVNLMGSERLEGRRERQTYPAQERYFIHDLQTYGPTDELLQLTSLATFAERELRNTDDVGPLALVHHMNELLCSLLFATKVLFLLSFLPSYL